jgi:hypothetical protein
VRTGLPDVYWRLINKGTPSSKSRTAQVDESMGQLSARSELDVDLAALGGDQRELRLSEAEPFLEAMNIEAAATLFYGNETTAPEEFTGFAARFSDLSAANAQNIIDAGGTGSDNSSIYFVAWGKNSVHGIFPKGSMAGIQHKDLGEGDAFDSDNNRFRALMDEWKWNIGLCVRDWRQVVRICNIDISNLVAEASAADLRKIMIKGLHRVHAKQNGTLVIYMNRTVFEFLDIQRVDAVGAGGGITYKNVDGEEIPFFRGYPIYVCDALLETESRVT